jgi:hypothetical protein
MNIKEQVGKITREIESAPACGTVELVRLICELQAHLLTYVGVKADVFEEFTDEMRNNVLMAFCNSVLGSISNHHKPQQPYQNN